VETRPSRVERFTAVVALHGQHDLASREEVRVALASLRCDLLLDLSDCTFIDSTVIGTIMKAARTLASQGYRLELVLPPPDSQVAKTLALVGLPDLLGAHADLASADANGPDS
jgi:anti-sigma B factor antagonist